MFTYGFSQGGYGALKYGRKLNAEFALSFSPQWSINPADVATFDRRFMSNYNPKRGNGERIVQSDLPKKCFVFFDSYDAADRTNVARLSEMSGVVVVPMPFAGHATIRIITEAQQGPSLIKLALEQGVPSQSQLRGIVRVSRRSSTSYASQRAIQLFESRGRHPEWYQQALRLQPSGPQKTLLQVKQDLEAGDEASARTKLESLPDDELKLVDFGPHWKVFRYNDFGYGELRLLQLYPVKYPNEAFQRLHGANSLVHLGMTENAIKELAEIQALPKAKDFISFFVDLYTKLKAPERAEMFADSLDALFSSDPNERLRIGFEFLTAYKRTRRHLEAFSLAKKLRAVCPTHRVDYLQQLLECFVDLSEFETAESMLPQIPREYYRDTVFAVLALECAVHDNERAVPLIRKAMKSDSQDHNYWTRLALVSERAFGVGYAVKVFRRALHMVPDNGTELRLRLIRKILAQNDLGDKDLREAAAELQTLVRQAQSGEFDPREIIGFALQCKRADLASAVAESWLSREPLNVEARLEVCRSQAEAGDLSAARRLWPLMDRVAHGLRLSREQFIQVIDLALRVDPALARRATELGGLAYPGDKAFRSLPLANDFALKFFVKDSAASPGRQRRPRTTLMTWFSRRLWLTKA